MFENFLYAALPYLAILFFFGGTLYRALSKHWTWSARGDYFWSSRSTGFFGRASIGPAAITIHWGIIILFVTHLGGLIGGAYGETWWVNQFFRWGGQAGGILFLYGLIWAFIRRMFIKQVRYMSNADDFITLILLIIITVLGLWQATVAQVWGISFSAGEWLGGILKLQPDPSLIAGAPLLNQLHIIFAMLFFIYFPFSKMVHAASFPLVYLFRKFISLRPVGALKK